MRSTQRPVAVGMLFSAFCVLGTISFHRLPVDLLPDVSYPKLVIYTAAPGVGPAEVERFISTRVEEQVMGVPGAREVESVSREGASVVTVRFVWGTDMDFAVLNVRERLQALEDGLPRQADRPVVLRTDPRSEPVMAISLAGGSDLRAMKELAVSVFRRRLEQIEGVAQVAVAGGVEREIQVEVDPEKLEAFGITMEQVAGALAAANYSLPGGRVRRGRFNYHLRTLGELESVEQFGGVVVARSAGESGGQVVVSLRDVAVVRDALEERTSIARYNGRESVGLLLFKEADANTVRLAEHVAEVLNELREDHPELQLDVATSQARFIGDAISHVVQALVLGGILAFLVLFLFLRDVRYPLAIALAIPVSVVATFGLLDLAQVSLNIMSLGGLALGVGMLVDNSIVVLENIFRHRELQATGVEPTTVDAAAVGTEEVQGAITASTLTTISVFGPILYVQGVAGELLSSLAYAVAFSMLISLLVALILLPAMFGRRGPATSERMARRPRALRWPGRLMEAGQRSLWGPPLRAFDRAFDRFTARYHAVLKAALRQRGRVAATTGVLFLVALGLGGSLERRVLPDVDHGSFQVGVELPPGTRLDRTAAVVTRLEAVLLAEPGVAAVFSQVGQQAAAGMGHGETGAHTATLDVRMDDRVATGDVLRSLAPRLRQFPPGELSVSARRATVLGKLMSGDATDIAVRIHGEDMAGALLLGRTLERVMGGIPSLAAVRLGAGLGEPEVQVEIDRERAAAYGIAPQRIAETVERYIIGVRATDLMEFDRPIPVVVRLPERVRQSLSTLDEMRVDHVPLRELVHVREASGPSEIQRREQARVVPVYADVAGGGLPEAVGDIRRALSGHPVPAGLRLEIGGETDEMRRSFRDVGVAFGLALLLVYMILAAQLESFVHPFTILLSVPLSLVGALVALRLAGGGLNVMSLIGMVILVGIVVNDAIVKVEFINQARKRGASVRDAILEAGSARLRPIVMTTVTTVLGLAPMALGLGRGADLRAPLAVAVIGGLLSATALTLIVVPVAYDLVESARQRIIPEATPTPSTER